MDEKFITLFPPMNEVVNCLRDYKAEQQTQQENLNSGGSLQCSHYSQLLCS